MEKLVSDRVQQNSSWSSTARTFFRLMPVVVVLGSFLPLVFLQLRFLWGSEHYQYFPFVLAAVAFFVWKRQTPERNLRKQSRLVRIVRTVLLVLGFVLLLGATLLWSPWLGMVAAVVTLGAFMCSARLGNRDVGEKSPRESLELFFCSTGNRAEYIFKPGQIHSARHLAHGLGVKFSGFCQCLVDRRR